MKTYKLLALLIITLLFSCCKKEEMTLVGDLRITFTYTSEITNNDIFVYIYFAENNDAALYSSINPNSNGVIQIKNLNHGNYVLYLSHPGGARKYGFQITAGKETELKYNL
jgi:hypothetical protein